MWRWIFLVSYLALGIALNTFVDDPVATFLPRSVALVLIVVVLASWVVLFWWLFRSTPMSSREKGVAWLYAAAAMCGLLAILWVGHFLTSLTWSSFWLVLAFAFALAARLLTPRLSFPTRTPFTLETELPSHVTTPDDA
jgi:hypothetical protein